MKKLSISLIALISLTACSTPEVAPDLNSIQNTTNVNAAAATKTKNSIGSDFARQVVMSLDLNKDGQVDANEVPVLIGGKNIEYVRNSDDSLTGYLPTKSLSVNALVDMMSKGASLSIMGSKTAEKNRDKIVSSLVSVLVKDPLAEDGKVYGYATTIGYFTGKTTVVVRKMDSSLLSKRITEQLKIGNGTINGQPYQSSNGSLSIKGNYVTIDGKYKSRLNFSQYDTFDAGIQLIGSHKIKDASAKVIEE